MVVEDVVAAELGGVKVHVAAGEIGVSRVHQFGDDFDIVIDQARGWLDHIGALDVQLAAVVKEGVGVKLRDVHDGLVLPLGALEHLVLAGVGVGGQVAHVGDVHHPVHAVSGAAQILLQHVLHDIAAQVPDVGEVVHRGSAGVHLHMARGVRLELLFFVGRGIV